MQELLSSTWFWCVIAGALSYWIATRDADSGTDLFLNYIFRTIYTLVLLFVALELSISVDLLKGGRQESFMVIILSGPAFVIFSFIFGDHEPKNITKGLFKYCASLYQAALGLILGIGLYQWYKNPDLDAAEPTIAALSATIGFLQWAKTVWKELNE